MTLVAVDKLEVDILGDYIFYGPLEHVKFVLANDVSWVCSNINPL
jgi:hypothetical protein